MIMEICIRPKTKKERQKMKFPTEEGDYEDEVMKKSRMKLILKKKKNSFRAIC